MAVWSNRVLILLGALGIFITGVLSLTTLLGLQVPCGGNLGCAIVQQSEFSKFPAETGVPVAYLGLAGYVAIFLLTLLRSTWTGNAFRKSAYVGFAFAAFGTVFSLYLTYLSISLIGQKCIWCLSSLGVIILTTIAHAALIQADAPTERDTRVGVGSSFFLLTAAFAAGWITVKNQERDIDVTVLNVDATAVSGEEMIPEQEKMFGDKNGAVTVVEFFDINCGTCRAVYPQLKQTISKNGKGVRLAVRHYPLLNKPGHETSPAAAAIAEYAAEKGMFWRYLDEVMRSNNTERIRTIDGLIAVAGEAGLNRGEILTIFKSEDPANKAIAEQYWQKVDEDLRLGNLVQIQSTPTLIIYADGQDPQAVATHNLDKVLNRAPYRGLIGGN